MNNSEKIKAIKLAAASEFGKEVEVFVDGKRVADLPEDCCWWLRQIDYPLSIDEIECSSFLYRLDVQRGDINSHTLFDLRKDITEEEIARNFRALNVSYEEYVEEFAGA